MIPHFSVSNGHEDTRKRMFSTSQSVVGAEVEARDILESRDPPEFLRIHRRVDFRLDWNVFDDSCDGADPQTSFVRSDSTTAITFEVLPPPIWKIFNGDNDGIDPTRASNSTRTVLDSECEASISTEISTFDGIFKTACVF